MTGAGNCPPAEEWTAEESGITQIPSHASNKEYDADMAQWLTPRQQEVAILLALGYTCREISERVGCAVKTVDTHRSHILERLDLRDNVDLARLALRRGWVTL